METDRRDVRPPRRCATTSTTLSLGHDAQTTTIDEQTSERRASKMATMAQNIHQLTSLTIGVSNMDFFYSYMVSREMKNKYVS
jgi:hypothetical protein